MTREQLKDLGFKEIPHFTVGDSLIYDLGRGRQIVISSLRSPNEMIFLIQKSNVVSTLITDTVVLKNYDYDGYTPIETIQELIKLLS